MVVNNRALHVIHTLLRTLMRVRQYSFSQANIAENRKNSAITFSQFRKIKAEKEDTTTCSRSQSFLCKQAQHIINPNYIQNKLVH